MWWTGPVHAPRRYLVAADAIRDAVAGGEGLVYRALDTERDVPVALKLLTVVGVGDYARIVERASPFTSITHPNLMAHVEVFMGTALTREPAPDLDDVDVIYTVADWIDGRPMTEVAAAAGTRELLGHVAGIARGLDALHRHRSEAAPLGIVHRDVKPSNVRIADDGTAVLIDFGVARPLDDADLTEGVGTYRWRAPEVLSGSASIGSAVDAWGLGAVAYWVIAGQPPGLDGAPAVREQLVHARRCRELVDPVGTAAHIALLLETDPVRRPADLGRWASQLDAVLEGRRRTTWKRPTAATAVVVMAIPAAIVLAGTLGDRDGSTATTGVPAAASNPETGSTALPAPSAGASFQVPVGPSELDSPVGDTWVVDCIGGTESIIVTGAAALERIDVSTRWASGTGPTPEPASFAASTAGRDTEVIADRLGSFTVDWHCDRSEVGVPIVLELVGAQSGSRADIRVESEDLLSDITIVARSHWTRATGAIRAPVGATFDVVVFPLLTSAGEAAAGARPIRYSGRAFDPRLELTSLDPAVARIDDVVRGDALGWALSAVAPGITRLEARLPGTELVVSMDVEVVDPGDPPRSAAGFAPGVLATYLAGVVGDPTEPVTARPVDAPAELFPACGDIAAFDDRSWIAADLLDGPDVVVEGWPTPWTIVYSFADDAAAALFAATLRAALDERAGLECEYDGSVGPGVFAPSTVIDTVEVRAPVTATGPDTTWGVSIFAIGNAVVVDHGTDDDVQIVRDALRRAIT